MIAFGDARLPQRFWDKVEPEPNTGCWVWTGADDGNGYGHFGWHRKVRRAHWVAYTVLVGPVPDGTELDHRCRVKPCCNPDHVEPVTHAENVLRGLPYSQVFRNRTHCPNGHSLDGVRKRGNGRSYRYCLTCQRLRNYVVRGKNGNESERATRQTV